MWPVVVCLAIVDWLCSGTVLALWTVSVSAAVIQRYLSFTVVALIIHTTERRGMAAEQVITDFKPVTIELVIATIVRQVLLQQQLQGE